MRRCGGPLLGGVPGAGDLGVRPRRRCDRRHAGGRRGVRHQARRPGPAGRGGPHGRGGRVRTLGQLADLVRATLVEPAPAAGALSPREQQTLDLIASGFTHAQVASRMGVRKATVDTYVERIRAKLQLGNKAELTRAALDPAHRARPA
ncbi:LuxR C-terminal-related transcriptional regulator [Dactylosporangium sp. NPDC049140]|uniref:helix-turn-helix transcriptional regulator n=1 Tax=Dactylosporangium sp. NPDC049140 TaxID=3155647 RepID=UPI0033EFA8DD